MTPSKNMAGFFMARIKNDQTVAHLNKIAAGIDGSLLQPVRRVDETGLVTVMHMMSAEVGNITRGFNFIDLLEQVFFISEKMDKDGARETIEAELARDPDFGNLVAVSKTFSWFRPAGENDKGRFPIFINVDNVPFVVDAK